MRDRRHILDAGDFEAGVVKRAYGGFTTRAGTFDVNVKILHTIFLGGLATAIGCYLSGKGSALA